MGGESTSHGVEQHLETIDEFTCSVNLSQDAPSPTKVLQNSESSYSESEPFSPAKKLNISAITNNANTSHNTTHTRRRLPIVPTHCGSKPAGTTRLYEQIDFLQGMIERQQGTISSQQIQMETLVGHLNQLQNKNIQIFEQQEQLRKQHQDQQIEQYQLHQQNITEQLRQQHTIFKEQFETQQHKLELVKQHLKNTENELENQQQSSTQQQQMQ